MITISDSEPDGECNAGKTIFMIEVLSLRTVEILGLQVLMMKHGSGLKAYEIYCKCKHLDD